MNVLSLFDGISCGRLALDRAGIKVDKYYASEIDKYAMQVSSKNWPDIIQLGSVTDWKNWNIDFSSIDLLLAGFPCQAWSVAGKQKGDNDPRGALVHDLIDIWQEIKKHNPKVKFLFENVEMKKEFLQYVNNLFGVEPIFINSRVVSGQDRKRYYWTNINGVTPPDDKNINAIDLLETPGFFGAMRGRRINEDGKRSDYNKRIPIVQYIECRNDNKSNCITTVQKDNVIVNKKVKRQCIKDIEYRYLTLIECERLQTLPDNFTAGVSNTQRYKCLGNGWTVDVIAHIFKGLIKKRKAEK